MTKKMDFILATLKAIQRRLYRYAILPLGWRLQGLEVRSYLRELRSSEVLEEEALHKLQLAKLKRLLDHAYRFSDHYRGAFDKAGFKVDEVQSLTDLQKAPVLEKRELGRNRSALFLTDSASRPRKITRMTAGTTGRPIEVVHDAETIARQLAARYRCFAWHGIGVGDREARFWGRRTHKQHEFLLNKVLNRSVFQFLANDGADPKKEAERLLTFRPDYFYGYSSLILRATLYWKKNKLPLPNIKAVIATAENLTKFQRFQIEDVFQCPVVMEYGCSETDIIAFQCKQNNYHIVAENVLVEIDPINDQEGEVLITDLNNKLTPLIRYRLGDFVHRIDGVCSCGRKLPLLGEITGRTTQRFIKLGNNQEKHAVLFAYLMEQLYEKGYDIEQFMVTQETLNQFQVRLSVGDNGGNAKLSASIIESIKDQLGQEVDVGVVYGMIDQVPGEKVNYFVSRV